MAPLSPRIFLTALALPPLTSAWTIVWRNSTAGATIINEDKPENCTQIWHQQGEPFSWDPEGKWCMHFYKDPTCTQIAGYACDGRVWRQDASRNLDAFDVYPMPPESVSVIFPSTSTSSKSTTTSGLKTATGTSSAVTTTPTAAETQSATSAAGSTTPTATPSSPPLSGGAIAGIIIGAIAALAALAALFFFFGRRNRKAAAPPDTKPSAIATSPQSQQFPPGSPVDPVSTNDTASAGAAPVPAYIVPHKQELAETEMSQAPYPHGHPRAYGNSKYVELPGNGAEAELSDSRQVHEMDGARDVKRPIYEAA